MKIFILYALIIIAYIINGNESMNKDGSCKDEETFRNYDNGPRTDIVRKHYSDMRKYQTMEYVTRMEKKWLPLDKDELDLRGIMSALSDYVDASDPDVELPNVVHNFETAEAIRRDGLPDWMQLVGLLHDAGKMQFKYGTEEDGQSGKADGKQFALGGDTWIVGCAIPDTVVLNDLNSLNPDMKNPIYNTELGIYNEKAGIFNGSVKFVWGHDEYMFRVLEKQSILPKEGLAMVRLHSLYPWHEMGSYAKFEKDEDKVLKSWIKLFNKYDLYEKKKDRDLNRNFEDVLPYYEALFKKYIPSGKLRF